MEIEHHDKAWRWSFMLLAIQFVPTPIYGNSLQEQPVSSSQQVVSSHHARKEIKHPENSMHAHIFYLQNNYATEALISLVAALHCAGCRAVPTKLFGCSRSRRAHHSRSSAVLLKAIESGCT